MPVELYGYAPQLLVIPMSRDHLTVKAKSAQRTTKKLLNSCAKRMNPQKTAMSHLSNTYYYSDEVRPETQKVLPENQGSEFHPNRKPFFSEGPLRSLLSSFDPSIFIGIGSIQIFDVYVS